MDALEIFLSRKLRKVIRDMQTTRHLKTETANDEINETCQWDQTRICEWGKQLAKVDEDLCILAEKTDAGQ